MPSIELRDRRASATPPLRFEEFLWGARARISEITRDPKLGSFALHFSPAAQDPERFLPGLRHFVNSSTVQDLLISIVLTGTHVFRLVQYPSGRTSHSSTFIPEQAEGISQGALPRRLVERLLRLDDLPRRWD